MIIISSKGSMSAQTSAFFIALSAFLLAPPTSARAQDSSMASPGMDPVMKHKATPPPIGTMASRVFKKGKFMISQRYKRTQKQGLLQGRHDISPETAATTAPNIYFGQPGQPATLRVVPLNPTGEVHMTGLAYGLTNNLTLSTMVPYISRTVDMLTFQGATGTTRLGVVKLRSKGLGDIKIASRYRLYDTPHHHLLLNAGLSLPTGGIEQTDTTLTPMNTRTEKRLGYGLQLGSGTVDALPGLTYWGSSGDLQWGLMYRGVLRLEERNENGWRRGHKHSLSGWVGYQLTPWMNSTVRISGSTEDDIHGFDPLIAGASLGCQPGNFGGENIDAHFGVNFFAKHGPLKGKRLGIEVGVPLYQNANGVQPKKELSVMAGLTWMF